MTDKAVAQRIKKFRKDSGMTQAALAKKAGVSTNTVARLERGLHRASSESVEKLAKALGVTASDILNY
jgi:transcriptional regulator with XRE-family HTH domain